MPRVVVANLSLMRVQTVGVPVTVNASPFTWTATAPSLVVVTGGVVTLIEISSDGVNFVSVGLIAGQYLLASGWSIRITAPVTKPTMMVYAL